MAGRRDTRLVRKELSDRLRERREALSKLAPVPGLDGAARFRGQSASVVVEPLVLGFEIVVKVRAQVGDDLVVDASSWLGRLSRQEIMVDLVVVSSQAEMEMA